MGYHQNTYHSFNQSMAYPLQSAGNIGRGIQFPQNHYAGAAYPYAQAQSYASQTHNNYAMAYQHNYAQRVTAHKKTPQQPTSGHYAPSRVAFDQKSDFSNPWSKQPNPVPRAHKNGKNSQSKLSVLPKQESSGKEESKKDEILDSSSDDESGSGNNVEGFKLGDLDKKRIKNAAKRKKKRAKKQTLKQVYNDIETQQKEERKQFYEHFRIGQATVGLAERMRPRNFSFQELDGLSYGAIDEICQMIKQFTLIKDSLRQEKNSNTIKKNKLCLNQDDSGETESHQV